MEPAIPEHLLPAKKVEDIHVGVVNETGLDNASFKHGDIAKLGQELGVITLTGSLMDSLQQVGADMHNAGVVQVANGLAYVSAASMTQVLLKLTEDALKADVKGREKITKALAHLAGSIDKQNRTMKMDLVNGAGGGHKPPAGKNKSFQPHQHVHFHMAAPSK